MHFRRLHHFIEVAEISNLSKAAKRLNIVQPALSQSIRRLESELGVTLFTRSRKGMELTEAGQKFLSSAYGLLNQYNRAREDISTIGKDPKGVVSIAMTASAMNVLTVPLFELLQARYSKIELNIEEGLAGNILKGFESGAYDLVVSYLANEAEGVSTEALIEEELFLTGRFDHESESEDVSFARLKNYPLILPQQKHGVRQMVIEAAEQRGIELNELPVTAALQPTIELVSSGKGYSLFPMSAIHNRLDRRGLTARRIVRPRLTHTVALSFPTHRPLTQATLVVMGLVREAVEKVHAEGKWPGRLLVSK